MNKFLKQLNPKQSIVGLVICMVLLALMPFIAKELGGTTWVRIIDMALLYVMLALGLNIVVGFSGLLDLGYVAFYAVGAYMVALLSSSHLSDNFAFFAQHFPNGLHIPLWVIVPLGAGLAALAGIMLGTPILKLRGDYLALVTLGFGEIIRIFMNNWGKTGFNLTNGPRGINKIDPVTVFGYPLDRTLTIGGILPRNFCTTTCFWHWQLSRFLSVIAYNTRAWGELGWHCVRMTLPQKRWASMCATLNCLHFHSAQLLAVWRAVCLLRSKALSHLNLSRSWSRL